MAHADRVHHMLLYGCTMPASEQGFWRGMETCGWGGGSYILYAWARNGKFKGRIVIKMKSCSSKPCSTKRCGILSGS